MVPFLEKKKDRFFTDDSEDALAWYGPEIGEGVYVTARHLAKETPLSRKKVSEALENLETAKIAKKTTFNGQTFYLFEHETVEEVVEAAQNRKE